ncbi:DM13 domain-containing protein [Photobacterium sanguinicancri]|uniref:DM13 domain-containing protein n=1 Tax=Photobacterium sanguinicancri TaxID=875932 RepID=UPI00247FFBB0|nr:DM13 domain-containing protein [Photobacterium sanguinicancri]
MKIEILIILLVSHLSVGAIGFALGIYALPILIAPTSPTATEVSTMSSQAQYSAEFRKDLKDSDSFHWGQGQVSVGPEFITLMGELAPGPDYNLYLSPEFVETEADFNRIKASMVQVGEVKTFENFVVQVPQGVDPSRYNAVIIWCETFGEFITAAKYQ